MMTELTITIALMVALAVAGGIVAGRRCRCRNWMHVDGRAFIAALLGTVLVAVAASYDRAGWRQTSVVFAWAGMAAMLVSLRWVAMYEAARRSVPWRSAMIGRCRDCGHVRVVDGRDLCGECGE